MIITKLETGIFYLCMFSIISLIDNSIFLLLIPLAAIPNRNCRPPWTVAVCFMPH